jgi:hypothetical protein
MFPSVRYRVDDACGLENVWSFYRAGIQLYSRKNVIGCCVKMWIRSTMRLRYGRL